MSDDLITSLENLTEDELRAVSKLINKFAKRKEKPRPEKKQKDRPPKTQQRGRKEPRSARNKRKTQSSVKRHGRRKKGVQARTEPVQIDNENKFLMMRERNSEKKDTSIDKKLWQNREPTVRPEKFEYAEVQCKKCGLWFDVHPGLIYVDPDTKEPTFTCDDCVAHNGGK